MPLSLFPRRPSSMPSCPFWRVLRKLLQGMPWYPAPGRSAAGGQQALGAPLLPRGGGWERYPFPQQRRVCAFQSPGFQGLRRVRHTKNRCVPSKRLMLKGERGGVCPVFILPTFSLPCSPTFSLPCSPTFSPLQTACVRRDAAARGAAPWGRRRRRAGKPASSSKRCAARRARVGPRDATGARRGGDRAHDTRDADGGTCPAGRHVGTRGLGRGGRRDMLRRFLTPPHPLRALVPGSSGMPPRRPAWRPATLAQQRARQTSPHAVGLAPRRLLVRMARRGSASSGARSPRPSPRLGPAVGPRLACLCGAGGVACASPTAAPPWRRLPRPPPEAWNASWA
jgi:hypothetical protein